MGEKKLKKRDSAKTSAFDPINKKLNGRIKLIPTIIGKNSIIVDTKNIKKSKATFENRFKTFKVRFKMSCLFCLISFIDKFK